MIRTVDAPAKSSAESGLWATFFLGEEMFALHVRDIQEVMMFQPVTPVPLAPDFVIGLLNLRGQIVPAIDLRRRLGFPVRPVDDDTGVLVLKTRDGLVGVVADEIGEVLELAPGRWRAPPETLAVEHRAFVSAVCPIENHVVLGLDVNILVGDQGQVRSGADTHPEEAGT